MLTVTGQFKVGDRVRYKDWHGRGQKKATVVKVLNCDMCPIVVLFDTHRPRGGTTSWRTHAEYLELLKEGDTGV